MQCIVKEKAHQRYEFGCKVGFVVSTKGNGIVGAQTFDTNPYDGHTLQKSLDQAEEIAGVKVQRAVCEQGYRGCFHRSSTKKSCGSCGAPMGAPAQCY